MLAGLQASLRKGNPGASNLASTSEQVHRAMWWDVVAVVCKRANQKAHAAVVGRGMTLARHLESTGGSDP